MEQYADWWHSVSPPQAHELFISVPASAGISDIETARAYMLAFGFDLHIDLDNITFKDGSFVAPYLPGVTQAQFENAVRLSPHFASGAFGLLHINGPHGVGFPPRDYRSFTYSGVPFSMQINFGPLGWRFDFDRYNPYQDLWSLFLHMVCEVGRLCR
jgi:hypothetical protein